MASEAEIERLYQLFVTNGGGSLSFDGTNLTPKQYSEAVSASNLTPYEMAQLEAKQHQYNRQAALNSIANEIEANNFTNPYAARGAYGNSLFSALGSSSAVTNEVTDLNNAFSGFSGADMALIFAGVLSQTGVDLEKFLKILGLSALGIGMYTSLTNHTNNQTANIPSTMQDASSLASMNEQFGEQGDPCSFFNQLMGLLAGIYDGTLDFIDNAIGDITTFLNDTGITSLLQSIIAAIVGAAGVVADVISAIVGVGIQLLGGIIGVVAQVINAIGDITSAIANEISSLADMAAELLRKALALVLGGAASDPCKRKVLENTGTTAMKDAVTQLNQPLGSGPPHMIGTTTDNRANAEEVKREMKYSRDEALLDPGVPQSPFAESSKNYVPKDSGEDSSLHSKMYNSSYKIEGKQITTRRYDDYKRFKKGEMTSKEEVAYLSEFTNTDLETGAVYKREIILTAAVYEEAYSKWTKKQRAYVKSLYTGSGNTYVQKTILSDIYRLTKVGDFTNKSSLHTRLQQLESGLASDYKVVRDLLNTKTIDTHFQYGTPDGRVDKFKEAEVKKNWETIIEPAIQRKYDLAVKNLAKTKSEWESIKKQVFENRTKAEEFDN